MITGAGSPEVAVTGGCVMRRATAFLGLAALLVWGACGNDEAARRVEATTSTPPESWDLVVISDSALGDGTNAGTNMAVPEAYARFIESDLGVEVNIVSFYYGGSTSQQVLDEMRGNESMSTALRSAEAILLWVPYGELKTVCPWRPAAYKPGPGTSEEYAACGAAMAESYGADADAIMSELVALRSPTDALVRTINLWVPFVPTFEAMELGPVVRANFDTLNDGLVAAATAHDIQIVDANEALMGLDGAGDPVTLGYVQAGDELHLTEQGVSEVARLLRELGYEHR
jgi:hypothetical protein